MPEKDASAGGSEQWQVLVSGESDEWATPPDFVRPIADAIGGFDLDPSSGAEESPIARRTIGKQENGLKFDWFGNVWLNPPYSDIGPWLQKAIHEVRQEGVNTVVALVKGDTSTDWFQKYGTKAEYICWVGKRLNFGGGSNAPFPSIVLVYGDVPREALRVLSHHGTVAPIDVLFRMDQSRINDPSNTDTDQ